MTDTTQTAEPEDFWNVTPERAGELLAQMTQQYNAAEAAGSDVKEPPRPLDGDGKPIAPVVFLTPQERDAHRAAETKNYLESNGFPSRDTPIGQDMWNMLEGRSPVSAELQAQVEHKLEALNKDAGWRRRLLEGEARAVQEFHLATGIIAAGKIQRWQG